MLQNLQKTIYVNKINPIIMKKNSFTNIFLKQNVKITTALNNNIPEGAITVVGRQTKLLRKISVKLQFQFLPSVSVFSYNLTRHFASTLGEPALVKKKRMAKLTEQERTEQLQPLLNCGWTMVKDRDAIYKEYLFKDFNQAFSFMTSIAMIAEKLNHHPEWFNVYNKVQITMSTHDVSGLSAKDIKVANFMEQQAKKLQ